MLQTVKSRMRRKIVGAGLVPARLAAGKENSTDTGAHRRAAHDPGRDKPCPYIVLIWACSIVAVLMLAACSGTNNKYAVGGIYQPAVDHNSWAKLNQRPRQSGAHNKFVTIYANESANEVKQHGGSYKVGATILKETFTDPNSPAVEEMFAMEKGAPGSAPRSNDWIWIVTDKTGKITASGEDAALNGRRCAMCHAGS